MIVSTLMLVGQIAVSNVDAATAAFSASMRTNVAINVECTNCTNGVCAGQRTMTVSCKMELGEENRNGKGVGGEGLLMSLLSGCVGALIVTALSGIVGLLRRSRERYSLLRAVSSECNFNLGILDELAEGVAKGESGSYKRVKSDFISELRKTSYRYWFSDDFYGCMAGVSCDYELLNRELEELQENLSAERRLKLGATTLYAIQGVRGSTTALKQKVEGMSRSNCLAKILNWN